MKTISALVLSAVALSPLVAHAADSNWYAVLSIGQSTFDDVVDDTSFSTTVDSSLDDTDTGYKIQAGYTFNENFAVEGGYVDLGRMNYDTGVASTARTLSINGDAGAELQAYGFNIDAVGILPLGSGFSLFGKVGAIIAHTESDASVTVTISDGVVTENIDDDGHKTETSLKPTAGVGFSFDLNETLSARIEYERFFGLKTEGDDVDVDLASIGLVARF
jgi:OOP family OmpA-OmpF porin